MNVSHLVRQAKKGNKEALLQLIMADQHTYYRLAYTYMGNEHDAMDAMEDEQDSTLAALTVDNPYCYAESEMNIEVMLSYLNAQQREAIELRYVHDLPYQTIADMTGAPLGTIKFYR